MYPLKKGKTTRQAHVGLPEGTYEEEHGRKGFYGKSAHLYHAHPPTGWIRFEGKLRPHCFDLNKLEPSDLRDPNGSPIAFLGNDDSAIPVSVRQTGDSAFEVVLAKPLAGGQTSVPFVFEWNGLIKDIQTVDHGRPSKIKYIPFS